MLTLEVFLTDDVDMLSAAIDSVNITPSKLDPLTKSRIKSLGIKRAGLFISCRTTLGAGEMLEQDSTRQE
jgi:hypothetical protein